MKLRIASLLLPIILLGCSREQPEKSGAVVSSDPSKPQVSFIESPETAEENDIRSRALALFTNKDYDGLEAMVIKYRASNEHFARGFAKLAVVYNALEPDGESESVWQNRLKEVQDWIGARPKSVTARISMARILTSYAWKARGSDYADKVKEENWQIFFSRLQKAKDTLDQAAKLGDKCPAYWSSLQLIALGLQYDRPKYDAVFNQAIRQFPEYEYYYNARATYLLPRWNGAEGEWVNDLTKTADKIGGEAGDILYAQVAWHIAHYGNSGNIFDENKGLSWERIDRGFEGILKQFPDSIAAMTERAHFAALAGDKDKARTYFLQTKGRVDLSTWDSKEEFERFLDWTFSP